MNNTQRNELVAAQVAQAQREFGRWFGLAAFPGRRFCIDGRDSYHDGAQVQLYVHAENADGTTTSFAKGAMDELRRQVVRLKQDSGFLTGRR